MAWWMWLLVAGGIVGWILLAAAVVWFIGLLSNMFNW